MGIFELQGVSLQMRDAIHAGNPTFAIKHFVNDGVERSDVQQSLGDVAATTDVRILDWTAMATDGRIYGAVNTRSKPMKSRKLS